MSLTWKREGSHRWHAEGKRGLYRIDEMEDTPLGPTFNLAIKPIGSDDFKRLAGAGGGQFPSRRIREGAELYEKTGSVVEKKEKVNG